MKKIPKIKVVFEFIVMLIFAICAAVSVKWGVAEIAEIIFKGGK